MWVDVFHGCYVKVLEAAIEAKVRTPKITSFHLNTFVVLRSLTVMLPSAHAVKLLQLFGIIKKSP